MSIAAVRILVVGHPSPSTVATLQRLEREGWSSHSVDTIAEAEGALKMIRFDVVLAEETIGAGSGYDLTESVGELDATLLVSVPLSEASLWLPVVQRGKLTLGDRALNASMLQFEVLEGLRAVAEIRKAPSARRPRANSADPIPQPATFANDRRTESEERRGKLVRDGSGPKHFLPPRRKPAAAESISNRDGASLTLESAKTGTVPRSGAPRRQLR